MKKPKKIASALVSVALVVGMAGCAATEAQQEQSNASADAESTATEDGEPDLSFSKRDRDPSYDEATATKIDLNGESASVSGDGAGASGSTVTISADGTYIVKGTLSNGQILVNLPGDEDKAQIVLDGAAIHNETGPAFYVQQADKVFVTLAEGTTNELTDGADYAATDDGNDPKAALYSKDDLTINGSGALNVIGNYYHGISSTDDLRVTGGTISVTSKEDAFHGKDAIKIGGGSLTANAGDDAFHSEYLFYIEDGIVNVEKCTEGYEAEKVYVYGGDTTIVASDDGVNAAAAEEDGTDGTTAQTMQPEVPPTMPDREERPMKSDRGPREEMREMPQGEKPDGQAMDRGGFGGRMGGGAMAGASQDCLIRINGGTLRVDAGGDGLDSNGYIEINGGTVLVSGSTNSANSGLDSEYGATVNGGDIIIVGAAGMAEDFKSGTQAHLMERVSGNAGSTVEVLDASGKVLVSYIAPKSFQCVVASAPNCSSITVR